MTNTLKAPVEKKYYDVLDGLRGVAAILVMFFHYCEMIFFPNYDEIPIGHGFLAVDFFFCLSGFVIAFAYDGRVKTIGKKNFLINRLIRLHPMVIMGTILGLISYLANPYTEINSSVGLIVLALVFSLFLIPFPWMQYREGELFPYNTPTWSLFFEYIANIVYMLILSRVNKYIVLVFGFISAGALIFCAQRSGWIINGWSIDFLSDGFARVSFSFTAGMLIYRFKWILKNKLGFVIPSLLLAGVLIFPHTTNDWIIECVLVIICLPMIVSLGAGATVEGTLRKLCLFLGKISYPLYLTHITTVTLFYYYHKENEITGVKLIPIVLGLGIFNIILAYVVLRFYDEPVRKWLKKFQKSK